MSALTSEHLWWTCLLYCACHATCIFPDPLQISHACHRFLEILPNPHVLLTFRKVQNPLRLPRKNKPEPSKVVWACGVFNIFECSEPVVFCTFWLSNALRATGACTFSTSQLPKVVREWFVFVHFDFQMCFAPQRCAIFHLARWLRTRRFSEPTFRPSGATNHWKNTVMRDFFTFSRTCIFFLLTLSLHWSSLFFSSLFWLPTSPYCWKFDF